MTSLKFGIGRCTSVSDIDFIKYILLEENFETFYSASEALRCAWFTRIGNANLYHARRPGAPTGGNVGGGGDGMTNGEPVATKRSKTQN